MKRSKIETTHQILILVWPYLVISKCSGVCRTNVWLANVAWAYDAVGLNRYKKKEATCGLKIPVWFCNETDMYIHTHTHTQTEEEAEKSREGKGRTLQMSNCFTLTL